VLCAVVPHAMQGVGAMRIIQSRELFAGRIVTLSLDEIVIADQRLEMERIRHPGGAAVVPVMIDGSVIMIEQFRYAVDAALWEIPAGRLEPGESPRACAARELEEETGYRAGHLEKLADMYSAPAYCTEIISVFLATGLQAGQQRLDGDESIRVVRMPLGEALQRVLTAGVSDAKTLVGLLMARDRIGEKATIPLTNNTLQCNDLA
jgi:ADP-ribose pyrophosphatase